MNATVPALPRKPSSLADHVSPLRRRLLAPKPQASGTPVRTRAVVKRARLLPGPVIDLGTNMRTDAPVQLLIRALQEQSVHLIGATRTGKTRLLRHMARELCRIRNAAVILLNAKGALGRHVRDDVIAMGQDHRLDIFDPQDYKRGISIGFDVLRANGLPPAIHAKVVREALRAGHGQNNLDQTQQLARFMYLAILCARTLGLTLVESLRILYPNSPLRQALMPRVTNPFVQESLRYLNSLDEYRQDQLLASTIARLESFMTYDTIRRIFTQQQHSHEVGLHCLLAHQYLSQLDLPDQNMRLRDSILNDAGIKIVFRLNAVHDARHFAEELFTTDFHPYWLKDTLDALELAPVEEVRASVTLARSGSTDHSVAYPTSESMAESEGHSRTTSHGRSVAQHDMQGLTHTQGHSYSEADGTARTTMGGWTYTQVDSEAHTDAESESESMTTGAAITTLDIQSKGVARGYDDQPYVQILPDHVTRSSVQTKGNTATGTHADTNSWSSTHADTNSHAEAYTDHYAEADTVSQVSTHGDSESDAHTRTVGTTISEDDHTAVGQSHETTRTTSKGVTPTDSEQAGWSESATFQPFIEHQKRRVPISRTYWTLEEYLTMGTQAIQGLLQGHFFMKFSGCSAVLVRAPYIPDPTLTDEAREQALTRVYSRPCYATLDDIDREERERTARLLAPPEEPEQKPRFWRKRTPETKEKKED